MAGFVKSAWSMVTTLLAEMEWIQEPVTPNPPGVDLSGRTVAITGGNAGLGYETARQLLTLKASRLILICRNVAKGEEASKQLLSTPEILKVNPNASIRVMRSDMADLDSVKAFAKKLSESGEIVDHLILNAGVASLEHKVIASGHETVLSVNYLANVVLLNELIPYFDACAEKKGSASRITWVGSRTHYKTTLEKRPVPKDREVIEFLDDKRNFAPFTHYNEVKLLCTMFVYELAQRLDRSKVEINIMCPGMVDTGMSDMLPWHYWWIFEIVKFIRARHVSVGALLIVYSSVIVGSESHGKFLQDKDIMESSRYIKTPDGQETQKRVWYETVRELKAQGSEPAPELLKSG